MDLYRNETDLFEMCCQVVEKKKKSYKRRNSDKHFANENSCIERSRKTNQFHRYNTDIKFRQTTAVPLQFDQFTIPRRALELFIYSDRSATPLAPTGE